jgi:hypothetical protein
VLMPGVQNPAQGSARVNAPLVAWLEPEGPITKNAPLTIHLTYALDPLFNNMVTTDTGSFSVGFTSPEENGRQTYPVTYKRTSAFLDIMGKVSPGIPTRRTEKTSLSYSGTFQIVVPDTTISCFSLEMHCGKGKMTLRYFFIEADDTIGFYGNHPIDPRILHKHDVVSTKSRQGKIDRDTLTQEQLQTHIEMAVELHGDEQLRMVEEILGPIPDTCRVIGQKGHYVIDMTLEQAFKLHDLGIGLEAARGKNLKKPKSKHAPDSSDKTGTSIESEKTASAPYGLSLDSVSVFTPSLNFSRSVGSCAIRRGGACDPTVVHFYMMCLKTQEDDPTTVSPI